MGVQQIQAAAEFDRLRSEESRLERLSREAAQTRSQNEANALAASSLKARIRALLTDANYRWPKELPFVRIPKVALRAIQPPAVFVPPGIVDPVAQELLGLSPEERQEVETALSRYFADLDQRIEGAVYETNRAIRGSPPSDAIASSVFVVSPLGAAANASVDRLTGDLGGVLGEDRWGLVKLGLDMQGTHTLRRVLGLDAAEQSWQLILSVSPTDTGDFTASYTWSGATASFGSAAIPLKQFLPQTAEDSGQAPASLNSSMLPQALINRMNRWLTEQAIARLSNSSQP